ncbi:hypothetical protein KEM48_014078 [Puccinia striiformis f. sp. tritici PST-130]|nr:hypothetical protein KEM48_014078 [Puccinia striiformis f. sp. tritici PST-130]
MFVSIRSNKSIHVNSISILDDIIWRGGFNQLLGIGNPSTAQTLGGEVVGGVPLLGGFYPTPTPLSPIPMSMDPTSSRTNAGARRESHLTLSHVCSELIGVHIFYSSNRTQHSNFTSFAITSSPWYTQYSNPSNKQISPPTFSPAFPPEITNAPIAPMTPMPSLSPGESSLNFPQTPDRFKLPPAIIAGIALGSVLIVFISLLGCWLIQRRRRATLAKRRTQRDSFLHNPIISSLLVPNQSSSSFRGTPYLGEGDMFYAGPPSLCRNTSSSFGHTFRYSHGQSADPVDDSRLNEVNYLDVMQGHPEWIAYVRSRRIVVDFYIQTSRKSAASQTLTPTRTVSTSRKRLRAKSQMTAKVRVRVGHRSGPDSHQDLSYFLKSQSSEQCRQTKRASFQLPACPGLQ